MTPFISAELIALAPWLAPVFVVVLAALAGVAGWLIESGIRRRGVARIVHLGAGVPLAGWLSLVALAAIGVIK